MLAVPRSFAADCGHCGLIFAAVVLNMIPAEAQAFATSHQSVGNQVLSDSGAQPPVLALAAALGPAGATFTAAIEQFFLQLTAAGSRLSGEYQRFAQTVRTGTAAIVATDASSGADFAPPPTIEL